MGSTFLSLHYHIVFSTKDWRPLILQDWPGGLHEYLGGTIRGLDGTPEAIGGVEDHMHLLVGLRASHCLADFVREVKKASSAWVKAKHDSQFGWQDGYAAFSASATHLAAIRDYIAKQEEHHRKLGFVDELKQLLERNQVHYNPEHLV